MKKNIMKISVVIMIVGLLSACGGGGGSSSSTDPNRLTEEQVSRIVAELNGKQVDATALNTHLSSFAEPAEQ